MFIKKHLKYNWIYLIIGISKLGYSDGPSAFGFLITRRERIKNIGKRLDMIGGMNIMKAARYTVHLRTNNVAAEELWAAWNGIGDWRW